jgi:hypothetical protein
MKNLNFFFCCSLLFVCSFFTKQMAAQRIGAEWVIPPVMDIDKFEISPAVDDSRFVVQHKGLAGVFDKNGKTVLPIEFNSINLLPCGWITAFKANKRLLFNANAENIGLPYDRFNAFNNGLAVVYKNNLCGLINQSGEELVPVEYAQFKQSEKTYIFTKPDGERRFDALPDFVSPNVKRVEDAKARSVVKGHIIIDKSKNEKGLLNMKGDTVVPPIYRFGPIHQKLGLIVASFDGKTRGIIDTHNQTLYPFTADRMGDWTASGLMPVRFEKQWALLRFPSGEVVFPFGEYEYVETYDPHQELFIVAKNNLRGVVNSKREVILPLEYTYISAYTHTTTELIGADNKKRGFWYRPNGFKMEPAFKSVRNLNDSLVIVSKDSLHAVLDAKTGREIIPFSTYQIDKAGNYFDSHIKFNFEIQHTYGGHLHGLYDRSGQLIFPHDSVDITVFPDNSFFVIPQYVDASKLCEHRSPDGKLLRALTKIGVYLGNHNFWIINSKNPKGEYETTYFPYFDPPGKERYFQGVAELKENLRLVKQDNKWGFTDDEGHTVIQIVLDAAEPSADGYIRAKYQGKWGVLKNPRFDYFESFEKGYL